MTGRQRNARGNGDQLRDQLVAAASELLLTPSPIVLPSLRAVARSCSVSPAAVYLHFDSQQELISAVIQTQMQALARTISAAVAVGRTDMERVHAFCIAYVTWGIEHPGAYQLLFESADRLSTAPHESDWSLLDSAARLVAMATEAEPSPSPSTVIAFRVWTTLHGIVSLRLHKINAPWPTPLDIEVRTVIDSLVGRTDSAM